MQKWEYCLAQVVEYREGNAPNDVRELLYVTMPGANKSSVTHPMGVMGLLNKLGSEGWELIAVEPSGFYLKRKAARAA